MTNTTPTNADYIAAIAAELKAERAATGVKNEAIAESANLSTRQVIRIFNGEREAGSVDLIGICAALGISVSELYARAEARVDKQAKN